MSWRGDPADLRASRPEPCISFGASPVAQVKGPRTWEQGSYEQGFLPLLVGYGGPHSRLAILPRPDLFMANRFAEAIPPPFVHGCGAKGKSVLQQRGALLPEAVWGNGTTVPLWAAAARGGSEPARIQLSQG